MIQVLFPLSVLVFGVILGSLITIGFHSRDQATQFGTILDTVGIKRKEFVKLSAQVDAIEAQVNRIEELVINDGLYVPTSTGPRRGPSDR